eukprot:CAMPEP_0115860140 /NCGR_PEP_ID=MMETSP0287-20121206/16972_1 /TAXON_ID=412157 /ORGANISM="Chrysochromulina rotalis, Strain UIO044" /LENGTH=264 /DNA_ID=CAMNT_0003314451 /DNA_START=662 /DNA_END=1454 /DNA_ORIENTATION=+
MRLQEAYAPDVGVDLRPGVSRRQRVLEADGERLQADPRRDAFLRRLLDLGMEIADPDAMDDDRLVVAQSLLGDPRLAGDLDGLLDAAALLAHLVRHRRLRRAVVVQVDVDDHHRHSLVRQPGRARHRSRRHAHLALVARLVLDGAQGALLDALAALDDRRRELEAVADWRLELAGEQRLLVAGGKGLRVQDREDRDDSRGPYALRQVPLAAHAVVVHPVTREQPEEPRLANHAALELYDFPAHAAPPAAVASTTTPAPAAIGRL